MKKLIIGAFVGAILLFAWQSLSWTVLHLHENAYKHTSQQDSLMTAINNSHLEEGQYLLPRLPNDSSHEAMMKYGEAHQGMPWAVITYHKQYKVDMVMPLVRGFLIALISAMFVCLIIQKFSRKNMSSIFGSVLSVGLICFIFVWYNQHNWFQTSWEVLKGELIDNLAGWGLCGIWLGWWYSKK